MRTRTIVLAALLAALVVDVAWLWAARIAAPGLGVRALVLHRLAALALAGCASYACAAALLTAAMVLADLARVRSRLAALTLPSPWDWTAAFAATSLSPLARRLLDLAPIDTERAHARIVLQSRFDPDRARREIAQLYSGLLVRTHFVTAFALALILALIGVTSGGGRLGLISAGIGAMPAVAAIAVPAVLAILGRMIATAAAEPLLETIANLPFERLDLELWRRLAGIAEGGEAARTAPTLSAAIGRLLERLVQSLEESRTALIEALARLSAEAAALSAALRAAAEREAGQGAGGAADLTELRAAVAQLTAALEKAAAAVRPLPSEAAGESAGEVPASGAARSQLSRELRDLLADLE
jgi:hypothetical protein